MRTFVLSLFTLATAISDAEKSLGKFLVNRTDPVEPCFRAEFVIKFRNGGDTVDFTDIKPILGLNNDNVNNITSNCDRLQIDNIPNESGGSFSLAIDINIREEAEGADWWEVNEINYTGYDTEGNDLGTFKNDSMQRISAPLAGTWGQSFLCNAGFDVELWNEDQDKFVTINLARLQIQPHKVPEDTFANPVICEEGKNINIVIPAIVGSILGVLVLVVLVSYFNLILLPLNHLL
ncbi:Oidioi.mRNA.OKI2018_I69.XSR.g14466.t2.cds [Oikopleura dioica]|uniref:Oidioi.mRNA.OKI2018_I69.XSR.g14466.t2.cds n=1 Tax=Oikopleura dioica TaxID=34765 RepID=A0ABN7SH57_OIKDI|nr:Oidioi.mRNA.OKI2018_I69.XSR.g14466.t2.cds [Oikopleura dioica]